MSLERRAAVSFAPRHRDSLRDAAAGHPMREIRREALVPHSPEQMFELIERVEDYPQFLPWCLSTSLIARTPDSVSATVVVGVRDLHVQRDHAQ